MSIPLLLLLLTAIPDSVRSEEPLELGEAVVKGKSATTQVREQPYAVAVADLRNLQNNSTTVMEAIDREAGVRVRESGGMGSGYDVSLNGLSGPAVRFFADGLPLSRYGSAFGLHSLPVNFVDRVEIYKGVVPPEFGSDALGGVVNLVTRDNDASFVDASVSAASYGGRQATGMVGWSPVESPWYATAHGSITRSDNSYEVSGPGVEVADPNTGRAIPYRAKRFHDGYETWSVIGEAGARRAEWADRFAVNVLYASVDKELQNGQTMAHVYGEAVSRGTTWGPSVRYSKAGFLHDAVTLTLYGSYTKTETTVIDTSSRRYDWTGAVVDEHPQNSELGSGSNGKSMLTLSDQTQLHQGSVAWDFTQNQRVLLHGTYDLTTRSGEDPFNGDRTASFRQPQDLQKVVAALSHRYSPDPRYVQFVWLKDYDFRASTVRQEYVNDTLGYSLRTYPAHAAVNSIGYGAAATYALPTDVRLKISGERSFRLPDSDELLGDGVFVRPSDSLRPEQSYNLNLGVADSRIPLGGAHSLSFEVLGFLRWTEDLILYVVQSNLGAGSHQNVGKTSGIGATAELGYRFAPLFDLRGNVTYQDLRDRRKRIGFDRNITYGDNLPNTPFLMANVDAGLTFDNVARASDRLRFSWSYGYVHAFYLNWPSLGTPGTKAEIPAQHRHDLGASYSLAGQRLNIGFDVKNVFDRQLYDNYLLQKPGREYSLKLRTYFEAGG